MKKTAKPCAAVKKSRLKKWAKGIFIFCLRMFLFVVMLAFLLLGAAWLAVNKIVNAQQISQAVTYQLQKVFDRPIEKFQIQ